MDRVKKIIEDVHDNGDKALIKYTEVFDGIKIKREDLEVTKNEWKKKAGSIDTEFLNILNKAAMNIKNYAEMQDIYKESEMDNNGVYIKDKFIPVESIGIYVPGGKYSYPSTVLMSAIPAKVAGVKKIYMVTPPEKLNSSVLRAAEIAGVDRIFRVGGAQAIAALAFGTRTIPKVEKIVGPGNKYVQEAKMLLSDKVGIDMIAGPSEVVIIADEFQDPEWIAVDLMAQAEHAMDCSSILITPSGSLIEEVKKQVQEEFSDRIKFLKVADFNSAVEKSNSLAPEHLQIMCADENISGIEDKIRNAGAVFLGSFTPVALGDYLAGPSHTLPTGRTAKFQEGLNVRSFLKKVSFIKCSNENIKNLAPLISGFANEEGMKYHAESVMKRI